MDSSKKPVPVAGTIYAIFAKLVKITACAGPRKQSMLHYKTSSGTPQRNTSEISTAKPKTTGPGKLIIKKHPTLRSIESKRLV